MQVFGCFLSGLHGDDNGGDAGRARIWILKRLTENCRRAIQELFNFCIGLLSLGKAGYTGENKYR